MMDLFVYLEKLELLAFFSAFPLYYFLVIVLATEYSFQKKWIVNLPNIIPLVYLIITFLYLGMKVNQIFDVHVFKLDLQNTITYFKIWSTLGLLFLIPYFRTKRIWTFFHSIPYTFLIVVDFIHYFKNQILKEVINNEMHLYFISFLLIVVVTLIVSFFVNFPFKKSLK